MPEAKGLDPEAIRRDRASGMTISDLAVRYGCAPSTISHHLHPNGAKPARAKKPRPAPVEAAKANGHKVNGNGNEISELNRFLDLRFQRLPFAAKVRLLVDAAQL